MSAFNFEHINLIPRKCIVNSRSECDTSVNLDDRNPSQRFNLPIVPANMECVIDKEIAIKLASHGYFYILHRFNMTTHDYIEFCSTMKTKGLISSISIGVNTEAYDILAALANHDVIPDYVTIDIAHGHSESMRKLIIWMKDYFKDKSKMPYIIAGNVSTGEAVRDLEEWGANAIKAGIGPGCFKGNTRILLADGTYKNIEDMEVGDLVINKDGNPVKVLNVMNKGVREVVKIKNNLHYDYTYVTDDHQFFIGDLSTSSYKSISSSGIAKLLDKKAKTAPRTSKYKWKMIKECDWKNTFALLPKNIQWSLPDDFTIDLIEYMNKGKYDDSTLWTTGSKCSSEKIFNRYIESSYELGYIFGTFLGDGSSHIWINSKTKCESGRVSWYFGLDETEICDKLIYCIEKVLGLKVEYKVNKNKNMNIITLYNKCITKLLHEFGKKTEKNLPKKYYCKNKDYIRGIYNGLIDSDGCIKHESRDKEDKYIFTFTNTSIPLIELFEWCCINLNISFSSRIHSVGSAGGLKDISDNAVFNKSYTTQTHIMNRYTKEFLYSNITDFDNKTELCETWDIEVDCDTHSFIANNMIVHNSACSTYTMTGFGSRGIQASCIKECADARKNPNTKIIADGGIKEPGDIAKSLALGADMVMIGGMFSGLIDSPGRIVEDSTGRKFKEFWGSASEHQSGKKSRIEGVRKLIPLNERHYLDEMNYLKECLQSSISYGGGKTIYVFKCVKYVVHTL